MRYLRIAAALAIAAYFAWFTADGLRSYFGPDDMMNLYLAWSPPVSEVWWSNLMFWSAPVGRPMGAAFYRTLFWVSGFNPLPFRIADLALVALNVWLAYALARRLAGSREAAATAALVFAYHPYLFDIYQNTGMIYDVLCFTFTASALLWYVRIRQSGREPRLAERLGIAALYICALNSKEMGVTFPVMLVAYELLFHARRGAGRAAAAGVLSTAAALALVTVPYAIGKQELAQNPAYTPVFKPAVFFRMWADYAQQLAHDAESFNARKLILLWVILLAFAWRLRSRPLWFAFAWLWVTMLPLVFVPQHRSGFVLYLPWFGWALYFGTLLARGREWLSARLDPTAARSAPAQSAAFLLTLALLVFVNRKPAPDAHWGHEQRAAVRAVAGQVAARRLRPKSRVLVTEDFADPDDFLLHFIFRLRHNDDTIVVDRVKQLRTFPDAAGYDWVLKIEDGSRGGGAGNR